MIRLWQNILKLGVWKWLERLGGRSTHDVIAAVQKHASLDEEDRLTERRELLVSLVAEAYRNVPFYNNLKNHAPPCEGLSFLCGIPVVSKDELRAGAEDFVSESCDQIPGKSVSGGSTGVPVTSFSDPAAPEIVKAAIIEGRAWWNIHPWSRCLSVWGHSKYMGAGWKESIKLGKQRALDAFANRRVIPAYDLSEEAVRRFNRAWHKDGPDYILGYASALYEIARVHRDLGLPIPAKECLVMTTGEVLHDWQEEVIEEVMGCKVIEEYGLVEAGAVAYTHPQGDGLKIIRSHFILEILDDEDEPVSCGQEGRIAITSLRRRQVPVIRYDTGDRAVCLDEAGGFDCSHISKVQGRAYDIIRKTDGTAVPGVIFTHAVKPLQQLDRFQIVQHELGGVVIYYTSAQQVDAATLEAVAAKICKEIGQDFKVSFEQVAELEAARSGKYRWICSEVN